MLPLFLIVFIDLLGFGIMIPLLPYYAKEFGASPGHISVLFSMYSIGQFFASPVWGRLSDRFGRKPVLIVSLIGSVASYLALAFATTLPALFVARIFAGLMAGNISTAQAYIADVTTSENRSKGMGIIGAAFGLGFIFGPVVGGVLSGPDPNHIQFATPSFVAAGLSATALLGVIFFLKESLSAARRAELRTTRKPGRMEAARIVLANPALKQLIVMLFLITTAMGILETSFTIWINGRFGWGPQRVGYVFAFIGIIMAAIQGGLIGRLTKRFGEHPILLAGSLMLLAGFIALPFSPSIAFLMVAITIHAAGYGLAQPTFNSLISKQSKASDTGLVMGVAQSAGSLSRIVGPWLSGFGFAWLGLKAPFLIGAAIMLPAVFLVLGARRTAATEPASAL